MTARSYSGQELASLQFDAAISCLSRDEPFARKLYALLASRLREVFLYSERQKDLVGQEGVALFGNIFRRTSRIVIVLYRDGWGETKWTGVESRAIQDLYLEGGRGRVLIYCMDESPPPSWIPSTYIYASGSIPIESFAEVISFRAREVGAEPPERDPLALARASKGRLEADARVRTMRRTSQAVSRALNEAESIFDRMEALVSEYSKESPGFARFVRLGKRSGALETVEVSVGYLWQNDTIDSVESARLLLVVSHSSAVVALQQGFGIVSEESFEFWPSPDESDWIWRAKDGQERSSSEMAEEAFRRLVAVHERLSLRRR